MAQLYCPRRARMTAPQEYPPTRAFDGAGDENRTRMASLEVSAGPSTNVRKRAEAGSGVTAANPQRPVLVARQWPGGGLVFDSEVNPLSKSARLCF